MVDASVILTALNKAETAPIAATLAGLSISASSFLMSLAKAKADIAAEKKSQWEAKRTEADGYGNPDERRPFDEVAKKAETAYLAAKDIADDAASAMKTLLYAFGFFVACLLERITLDPIVNEKILTDAAKFAGYTYEQWLPVDVTLSASSFVAGVFLLCLSARSIFKVIPKIG